MSCDCIDGSLPNIYHETSAPKVCHTIDKLDCISDAQIKYFSQNSTLVAECKSLQCPIECDSQSFEIATSSSRYPTAYYQSYLRAHTNILEKFPSGVPPELTRTTAYLSIFYEDLAYTFTEEVPAIDGFSVLGTIGGNLGLFIGASLLTFVEVIELIFEILFIIFDVRY